MESDEILKQVESKLNEKYEIEIDNIYRLEGAEEIIVFEFDSDEMCGLYSTKRNKVIFEPEICSDVTFHHEFNLISLDSYDNHELVWLDLGGKEVLRGGAILEEFANGCYYADIVFENFSGDRELYSKELIKPGLMNDDGADISGLVGGISDISQDATGKFLMITSQNSRKERLIGVYDLNNLKWLCEPQLVS